MIDLIKKAELWLENKDISNILEDDIRDFTKGNLTLKTVVDCLLDNEHKEELKNYFNKHELTDLEQIDLIGNLKDFPDWFFVFLPKNNIHIASILYSTYQEKELSSEIISYVEENYNYIERLQQYLIFNENIHFEYTIRSFQDKSIEEFFSKIDEDISLLNDIDIENVSIEKMKHFLLQDYIESSNIFYKNTMKDLFEHYEKYLKLYPQEITDLDEKQAIQELFRKVMPNELAMSGNYLFKRDLIKYSLNENPMDSISNFMSFYADKIQDKQKEKRNVQIKGAYAAGKVAISFIPGVNIISTIKEAVDSIDLMKDSVEALNDAKNYHFDNIELKDLIEEYHNSGEFDTFRDFFINLTKKTVYTSIEDNLSYKASIPYSVFEDLYNQFMNTRVKNIVFEEIQNGEFKNQYDTSDDKDLYMISYMLNQ